MRGLRALRPCAVATLSVAMLLGSAACAQTFDARSLGLEALMSSPAASQPQGEAFHLNRKAMYLMFGLFSVSRPSLREALASQVVGDQRVANLHIRVRSRWSDVLITALTAGLLVPRTVTYEGIVVNQ